MIDNITSICTHGDEFQGELRANFSSNVWYDANLEGLYEHLQIKMPLIKRYPEEHNFKLKKELGAHLNINPDNLLLTNGSIEGIYQIAQAFRNSVSIILQPTFSEYAKACMVNEHTIIYSQAIELEEQIAQHKPKLVWLCTPNNPDGSTFELSFLENLVEKYNETIFIFDISFNEYCREKQPDFRFSDKHSNTIILYSFTKRYSIPGLRIGLIYSNSSIISSIRKFSIPWTLNCFAVESIRYLITKHSDHFCLESWLDDRNKFMELINQLEGFECISSSTPFFLVKLQHSKSSDLKNYLLDKGILIRDASSFYDDNCQYIRLLTLSNEQNLLLINELYKWNQQ